MQLRMGLSSLFPGAPSRQNVQTRAESEFADGETIPISPGFRQSCSCQEHSFALGEPSGLGKVNVAVCTCRRYALVTPEQVGRRRQARHQTLNSKRAALSGGSSLAFGYFRKKYYGVAGAGAAPSAGAAAGSAGAAAGSAGASAGAASAGAA